MIVLSYH